jgi:hypothetical protein
MPTLHAGNGFADKLGLVADKFALNDEQFEALSLKAESQLKQSPSSYKWRVVLLALVGYAFIFAVLFSLLGLFVASVNFVISHHRVYGLKLILALGILLFVIFKALWIKKTVPQGIEVTRAEAPQLFKMLDELTGHLHTKVDKVLVDNALNAHVQQVAEMGFLGIYSNYLVLGMALMLTQRPEQYKAVLAHELGHLSGNHSRSTAWIYNLRIRWAQLLSEIQRDTSIVFFAPFYLFFSWFSPRFSAYSLAMARAHELEADADAVRITGARAFTESMLALEIYGNVLYDKFWPQVMSAARNSAEPEGKVFTAMQKHVADYAIDDNSLNKLLFDAINNPGSGASTHPSLKQRLTGGLFTPVLQLPDDTSALASSKEAAELCAAVRQPVAVNESAAHFYLGDLCEPLMRRLSAEWHEQIAEKWQADYEYFSSARARVAELDALSEAERGTVEVLKEKAYLVNILQDEKACRPIQREILALVSGDPYTNYNLGVSLIQEKNEEALPLLQTAMARQPMYTPEICFHLVKYFEDSGRKDEADQYRERARIFSDKLAQAKKERVSVDGKSMLDPHTLDVEDINYLRRILVHLVDINRVYAVNKHVELLPESPYLVLGIDMFEGAITHKSDEKLAMAQWLMANLELPCEFCVSIFDMSTAKLKANIKAMPDALIYEKGVDYGL